MKKLSGQIDDTGNTTMASTLTIPLRLDSLEPVKQDSLKSRISQIHAQKGFRNVTESSLTDEIKPQKDPDLTLEDDAEPESEKDQVQQLVKKKNEMLQLLRYGFHICQIQIDHL